MEVIFSGPSIGCSLVDVAIGIGKTSFEDDTLAESIMSYNEVSVNIRLLGLPPYANEKLQLLYNG